MLALRRLLLLTLALGAAAAGVAATVWFGVWIPNCPSEAAYPVRGIDVSHHQGEIRWEEVDSKRVQFAYIKATEGGDFRDGDFARNWSGAGAARITRGAYHFYTFGTPGKLQAANFAAVVPVEPDALPPAIDLEISGYNRRHAQPVAQFQRELADFVADVSARYGKVPVVYTTPDFQRDYLQGVPLERLWIREVFWRPAEPWLFWQFTPRGRVRGVTGFVDVNVFRGTRAEFESLRR